MGRTEPLSDYAERIQPGPHVLHASGNLGDDDGKLVRLLDVEERRRQVVLFFVERQDDRLRAAGVQKAVADSEDDGRGDDPDRSADDVKEWHLYASPLRMSVGCWEEERRQVRKTGGGRTIVQLRMG